MAHRNADRCFALAAAAFRREAYQESAERYREGLLLDPDDVPALLDYAKACEHLGEFDRALAALDRSQNLAPEHPVGIRRRERISEEKRVFDALAERLPADVDPRGFTLIADADVPVALRETAARALTQALREFEATLETSLSAFPSARLRLDAPTTAPNAPPWAAGIARNAASIGVFLRSPETHRGVVVALIRHECAHLFLREASGGNCPPWLDEALAEALSKPMMNWERRELNAAASRGRLLSLARLRRPFAGLPPEMVPLAYKQCAALGHHLLNRIGPPGFRELLREIRDGGEAETLLADRFGVRLDALEPPLFGSE